MACYARMQLRSYFLLVNNSFACK